MKTNLPLVSSILLVLLAMPVSAGTAVPAIARSKAFWDHVELRVGQPEELFVRLEAEADTGVPLTIRLTVPPEVRVVAGSGVSTPGLGQGLRSLPPGHEPQPRVAEQTANEWKRGEVVSNSCRTYFQFRRFKEKRLSSTVSWHLQADRPVDVMGRVEISGPGLETITLPVRFDFRARPQGLTQRKIPSPRPVLNPNYYVGVMHYPGWIPGQGSGWSLLAPYPEQKPALGYHDESQPDVASWEIKWALENGINFFMFCWYFQKDTPPTVDDLLDRDFWGPRHLRSVASRHTGRQQPDHHQLHPAEPG